jgi:hypothetical protein
MTTLTKVAHSITDTWKEFKDRVCNDGHFCDDIAMGLLSLTTAWMMWVAMQPIM